MLAAFGGRRTTTVKKVAPGSAAWNTPLCAEPSGSNPGSLTPLIVTVAADGTATGVAVGTATVQANSQSLQTTRSVKVLPRPPLIFVDNLETGDTSEWSLTAP